MLLGAAGGHADTIVATASARGPARRGIVRVSGPRALETAGALFGPAIGDAPGGARLAGAVSLDGLSIPAAALVFRAPRSYTGEDVVELHTLGAPPLLERIVAAIAACGARPARPGEFTRRAFLAGRIDLTAAEAVLALVSAEGEREARAALRQLRGGLAREVEALRETVLDALAEVEAAIDFAHEDIERDLLASADLAARLAAARARVARLLAREAGRGTSAARPAVLLHGAPNAGKSSLFNALAGSERAIVSPLPGTTRDALSATVTLAPGTEVDLIDAAGVGAAEPVGPPDLEAARRAEAHVAAADVLVVVVDGARPASPADLAALARTAGRPRAIALQKADLPPGLDPSSLPRAPGEMPPVVVSARTGAGLDALRARLAALLLAAGEREAQDEVAPNERHRACLAAAAAALDAALDLLARDGPPDLAAIDLRAAALAIGEVTGATCTEDILDRIFSRFCIGK
jgi:tRNA modification GTPase